MAKKDTDTTQTPIIPPELRPLVLQTAAMWEELQKEGMLRFMPEEFRDRWAPAAYAPETEQPKGGGPYINPPEGDGPKTPINPEPPEFPNPNPPEGPKPPEDDGGGDVNYQGKWGGKPPAKPPEGTPVVTNPPVLGQPRPGGFEGWVPFVPTGGGTDYESGGGVFGDYTRPIAGPSSLQEWASSLVPQIAERPEELGEVGRLLGDLEKLGQQRVTGENITSDPAYTAALSSFDTAMRPIIENQAALSGLGRSTALTNATAANQAQVLLPVVQDTLAREERGLDRQGGTLRSAIEGYMGLGDRAEDRLGRAIGTGMGVGEVGRDIAQEGSDAGYNERMRQLAFFENLFGGPLGLLPSTIGSQVTEESGDKLFG